MGNEFEISLCELLEAVSNSIDLVSDEVNRHHRQVAYVTMRLCEQMGLGAHEQRRASYAALIHDVGALTLKERRELMEMKFEDLHHHSEVGYWFLVDGKLLSPYAEVIRYHHYDWKNGDGSSFAGQEVPLASHVLHLADRCSVLLSQSENVLTGTREIMSKIRAASGDTFHPDAVDALESLAGQESFWLDASSKFTDRELQKNVEGKRLNLTHEQINEVGRVFQKIIDFRSSFTATHSAGVAEVATELAGACGFSDRDVREMRTAGYFHDLGKLCVPAEILEKEGELTDDEFALMRSHTYHTYRSLEVLSGFEKINRWASFHHEKLDGSGYPFKLSEDDLSKGARVMAVADIFTALTEDRPYREGMDKEETAGVLADMVDDKELDGSIVRTVLKNYDRFDQKRGVARDKSSQRYIEFSRNIQNSKFLAATG